MTGWIKIHRDIVNHWIYGNVNWRAWWIDLLLMAAWEDRTIEHDSHVFTLKRGQMIASISFLSQRWCVSNPTVIRYLKMLEKDDMIVRSILYRQTSIITICNYDNYQSLDDSIVYRQVDTQVDKQLYRQVYTIKEDKENNNIINNKDKEENILSKDNIKEEKKVDVRFVKPTVSQIADYCRERNNGVDAQSFFDYYEARGWCYGKTKIKDWKACVRTWERRNKQDKSSGMEVGVILKEKPKYTKGW